jgi:hypothetical protein
MVCQLEFFQHEPPSEIDCIKNEVKYVKESSDKVRKSMFARHGELARKYLELHERMQIIERNICGGASTSLRS